MRQKKLAALTSFFFLQENVWPFCQATKKSGFNDEVTVYRGVRKAGFTVLPSDYSAQCVISQARITAAAYCFTLPLETCGFL